MLSKDRKILDESSIIINDIKNNFSLDITLFDLQDIYYYFENNEKDYINYLSFNCNGTENDISNYISIIIKIQKLIYKKYLSYNLKKKSTNVWTDIGYYSKFYFTYDILTKKTENLKDNTILFSKNSYDFKKYTNQNELNHDELLLTNQIINNELLDFINKHEFLDEYYILLNYKNNKLTLKLNFLIMHS